MIESKQCEDELDLIFSFDSIFIAGAGVIMSEDEMLKENINETGNRRQGKSFSYHTLICNRWTSPFSDQ